MHRFAFIIHPIETRDVTRKYAFMNKIPEGVIKQITKLMPPQKVSKITGVKSPYGETEGWFIAVPLVSDQMLSLPADVVTKNNKGWENCGRAWC
jgi:hypothetical protein